MTTDERKRLRSLIGRLRREHLGIVKRSEAYEVQLPEDPTFYVDAFEIAIMERWCCPSLTFEFRTEGRDGPVWLVFSGGDEAKLRVARSGLFD